MKKIFLMAAVAMMMTACGGSKTAETSEQAETAATEVAQVQAGVQNLDNDQEFRPGQTQSVPTVLDFNATWCVPCKKLAPAFDQVAEQMAGKVRFVSVDIDRNPETAQVFGIQAVPTVVLINTDGTMTQHVGLTDFVEGLQSEDPSEEELTAVIAANMAKMIADLK